VSFVDSARDCDYLFLRKIKQINNIEKEELLFSVNFFFIKKIDKLS
jgi:hypothetical protein